MSRGLIFAEFLGLRRNVVLLLLAMVIIGAGEEMWIRFFPKYMEELGASVLLIGLFDGLKTLLGAVYAYPGGFLTDRWGHRRALSTFTTLSLAGYALVALFPDRWVAIGSTFLFLAWSDLSLPGTFSLVAANLPHQKHAMGIGVQSLVKRIPIVVGPVAGGLLMDRLGIIRGVRAGVVVTIVLGALALMLQQQIREPDTKRGAAYGQFRHIWHAMSPQLRRLLWSDILIRFCERIPYAWVIIYAMDYAHAQASAAGLLIAVEMGTAIACYIPASYFADRFGKEPFVIATFGLFTLFPLALMAAHSFSMLAIAFAIRGLKEFGEPARKSLIISYSPTGQRGQTIGAYYLIRDTAVTAGAFLGAALWKLGPEANFLTAAAIGAAGTGIYAASLRVDRSANGAMQ